MRAQKPLVEKQTRITNLKMVNIVEMVNIVKRFPGVLANAGISFDVHAGEMHALLGENGAGKSTLMRILYGLYRPDQGEVRINGAPVHIASPLDAIRLGIGMIHQHFMLVPSLTVAENVALGLPSSRGPLTDLDRVSQRIHELAEAYGLKVDPSACIWQLAVGQDRHADNSERWLCFCRSPARSDRLCRADPPWDLRILREGTPRRTCRRLGGRPVQ